MSTRQPTVIITGATGFLGSELVQHFSSKNWKVIAFARSVGKPQKNVRYVNYNLAKPVDENTFNGADYLVHAAYTKYSRKQPDALELNIQAAKKLLQASRQHKIKKNVFISSMSAHRQTESIYGQQKLAIEKLFNTKNDVVLRSGLIIGNGGIVKHMANFMKTKHLVPLVGGGRQPLQVIAVYDLVQVIERSLLDPKISGRYTIATPQVYSYKEFYRALAKKLNTKIVFLPAPMPVLLGALKIAESLHLPLNISRENALGFKQLRTINNSKDLKALCIQPDDLNKILQSIRFT